MTTRRARISAICDELDWLSRWQVGKLQKVALRLHSMFGVSLASPKVESAVLRAALERHVADTVKRYPTANAGLAASDAYDAACDALGVALCQQPELTSAVRSGLGAHTPGPGHAAGYSRLLNLARIVVDLGLTDAECVGALKLEYVLHPGGQRRP